MILYCGDRCGKNRRKARQDHVREKKNLCCLHSQLFRKRTAALVFTTLQVQTDLPKAVAWAACEVQSVRSFCVYEGVVEIFDILSAEELTPEH